MSRIHFITIKADKLAAIVVTGIILLGLTGYFIFLGMGMREATPVPRALLLRSLPVSTLPTPSAPTAAIGAPAPDFTLATTGGSDISLSSYKGKPVMLYFWASWCSFCRDDMPGLQKLQEANKATGLTILSVNLLEKEELVKSFANQFGVRIPMLLDSDGAVSANYLVRATPTYVFIDKNGLLKAQVVGKPRPAVFERNLALITELPSTEPNQTKAQLPTPPATSQAAPSKANTSPNLTITPTEPGAAANPAQPQPTKTTAPNLIIAPAPSTSSPTQPSAPNVTIAPAPTQSNTPNSSKTPTPTKPTSLNPSVTPKQ